MVRWLYGTVTVRDGEIVVRTGGVGWGDEMRRPIKRSSVGWVPGSDGQPALVITTAGHEPLVLLACRTEADVIRFVDQVGGRRPRPTAAE